MDTDNRERERERGRRGEISFLINLVYNSTGISFRLVQYLRLSHEVVDFTQSDEGGVVDESLYQVYPPGVGETLSGTQLLQEVTQLRHVL